MEETYRRNMEDMQAEHEQQVRDLEKDNKILHEQLDNLEGFRKI
jgi:hypothetical protein